MKIISPRTVIEAVTYHIYFDYVDQTNTGFGFTCDKYGRVLALDQIQRATYEACMTGEVNDLKVKKSGRVARRSRRVMPAIGECFCGTRVELSGFTNTCVKCGADYNSAGQRLAPREQWGEETGESIGDILRIR